MRITVADAISPSYFVAIAAVQLGFFKEEGVDMEFVFPPADRRRLAGGRRRLLGGSPYTGLHAFPGWRGGAVLCALSPTPTGSGGPLRSEVRARRRQCGERLAAERLRPARPHLKRLLGEAGIDFQRDNVRIVASPRSTSQNWAWMESTPSSKASRTATGATACGRTSE